MVGLDPGICVSYVVGHTVGYCILVLLSYLEGWILDWMVVELLGLCGMYVELSGPREKPTHHNPKLNEVLGTENGTAVGDHRDTTMQEAMLGTSISGFVHAQLVSNCPSTLARARAGWVGLFARVRATAVKHAP